MAELFDVNVPAINKHINNIYEDGELVKSSTISKMEIVQQEGNRYIKRKVDFYNLDAIIAVGYRVNSKKATQFRIWATDVLKEYIIKGFKIDTDLLTHSGSISHKQAIEKANKEYEKFRVKQDQEYVSSMDEMYKRYLKESKEVK